MDSVSKIVIRFNQQKRTLLYFVAGFMLITGIGIFVKSFSKKPFQNPYILPLGVVFILAFIAIVFYARKLLVHSTAVVIDDKGITDNANSGPVRFIPWGDVVEVNKKKVSGGKFICIHVNNPNDYLNRETSPAQQKRLEFNNTYCETPVVISSNNLSVDYYTLLEIIQRKHNLYKEQENYLKNEGLTAHL